MVNKGLTQIILFAILILAVIALYYIFIQPNPGQPGWSPLGPIQPPKPSASLNAVFDSSQICNGKETKLTLSARNTGTTTNLSLIVTINPVQPEKIVSFYYSNQEISSIDLGNVNPGETTTTKIIAVNGSSPIQQSTVKININLLNEGQVLDSKSFDFTVAKC